MDRRSLRKNRLDLEYKFEAQKANIFLTLGTITLVGFLGAMAIQQLFALGIGLSALVLFYAYLMHHRTRKRMAQILAKIERL